MEWRLLYSGLPLACSEVQQSRVETVGVETVVLSSRESRLPLAWFVSKKVSWNFFV